jgi:hypothetical protein
MITSALPVATAVQLAKRLPTVAAGLPLMITEDDPETMLAECVPHLRPGSRCGADVSPTLAAPRPLITTSADADAITYGLQCGIPASPRLAAAGMFYLHQSLKPWHPGSNFFMLRLGMWTWRDFGAEFYHMIERIGYVFIPVKLM